MEQRIAEVLAEYERRRQTEKPIIDALELDEFRARRDEFLLPLGERAATLVNLLIKDSGAKTILEVGTSYGYTTIWLAEAARETGGQVIGLEHDARKIEHAQQMLRRAGLEEHVRFEFGDAVARIPDVPGPFDFVLLDLWKDLYIPCFELVYPRLADGAFVVADNMLVPESTRPQAQAYRDLVRSKPDMESLLLPVGSGLEISRCVRAAG